MKTDFEVFRDVAELGRTESAAKCDAGRANRSVLELGPVEKVLKLGRGRVEDGKRESVRREASAVACFRLPALLYAASKATRLMTPRDGRCGMSLFVCVQFMVVRGLGYCQGAHT